MGTIQRHKTLPQILIDMALVMTPASSRSGAYSGIGFAPVGLGKGYFTMRAPGRKGKAKHAAEVRSVKRAQRRRMHLRSLRG